MIKRQALPLTISLLLTSAYASAASIDNPGFEDKFNSWYETDPSAISSDANSGSSSVKITGSSGRIEQSISVSSNTSYTLSGYILGSGTIGVNANGSVNTVSTDSNDWELVTVTFNTGAATDIEIFAAYNNGTGRFDDFAIAENSTSSPTPDTSPTPSATQESCSAANIEILAATDDGSNDGHGPSFAIDNNLDSESRWSSAGDGKTIELDLGANYTLSSVNTAWYSGDSRTAYFDIETSADTGVWTLVLSNAQSQGDTSLARDEIEAIDARYVRIVGHGNSANEWNSLIEVDIEGCSTTTTTTPTPTPSITPTPIPTPNVTPTPTPTPSSTYSQCNIDMSIWGYTLGDGISRNEKSDIQDLIDNTTLGGDEITWDNGCPTFKVDNQGASSSSSSFARSELRELSQMYFDQSYDDTDLENQWVTSEASDDRQNQAGGVDGKMTATLKVNTVSIDSTKTDQLGRIIVGQIHAEDHEPVKIYYQKLPQFENGSVYFTVDGASGSPVDRINVVGFTDKYDTDENADEIENPVNGIPLGDIWSYEIKLIGDQLTVTVWHDGKTYTTGDSLAYTRTRSKQTINNTSDIDAITIEDFYASDYMYFKAGLYNQNNTGTEDPAYASVTFYEIDVEHY